jgi:LPXTG-motif cell wall-anchored protein
MEQKKVSAKHSVKIKNQGFLNRGSSTSGSLPKTGDGSMVLWMGGAVIALACLVFFAGKRYNRKK